MNKLNINLIVNEFGIAPDSFLYYAPGQSGGFHNKKYYLAYGYRNFRRFRNRILHIFAYQKRKNTDNLKEVA